MPHLVAPTARLYSSWLAAQEEWGPDAHMDGAGLGSDDDVTTVRGFAAWTEKLRARADRTAPAEQGLVHATHWWMAEGDTYLGAIDLRHYLNAFLLDAGGPHRLRRPSLGARTRPGRLGPRRGPARGAAARHGPGPAHLRPRQRGLRPHHRAGRRRPGRRTGDPGRPQAPLLDHPLTAGVAEAGEAGDPCASPESSSARSMAGRSQWPQV
ncbi:hypothetical protein SSNG_00351 [Streptomyces sp. C]|nr:hypothetical protein SSNG_00351 [Streptomyces sp. C]